MFIYPGYPKRADYCLSNKFPDPPSIAQAQSTRGAGKHKQVPEAGFIYLIKTLSHKEKGRNRESLNDPGWRKSFLGAYYSGMGKRNSVAAVWRS